MNKEWIPKHLRRFMPNLEDIIDEPQDETKKEAV